MKHCSCYVCYVYMQFEENYSLDIRILLVNPTYLDIYIPKCVCYLVFLKYVFICYFNYKLKLK